MCVLVSCIGTTSDEGLLASETNEEDKITGRSVEKDTSGLFPSVIGYELKGGGECSGTIVSSRHILTAAHCVDTYDVEVEAGSDQTRSPRAIQRLYQQNGEHLQYIPVGKHKVFISEGWKSSYYDAVRDVNRKVFHDIALIEIETVRLSEGEEQPIDVLGWKEFASPIDLKTSSRYFDQDVTMVGYSPMYLVWDEVSMRAELRTRDVARRYGPSNTDKCKSQYEYANRCFKDVIYDYRKTNDESTLTGGDSGGAQFMLRRDKAPLLAGVNSFSSFQNTATDGGNNRVSGSTRVNFHLSFIRTHAPEVIGFAEMHQ